MSNVTLTIAGRDYVVGCASGEEEHIADLGRMIESRLDSLPPAAVQGESRALLFAALLLADELYEARKGDVALPAAETETHPAIPLDAEPMLPEAKAEAETAHIPAPEPFDDTDRLTDLALRLENLATLMEDPLEDRPFRS